MLRTHKTLNVVFTPNLLNTTLWQNTDQWYEKESYFYFDLYYQNFQEQVTSLNVTNPSKRFTESPYDYIHDEWFIHHKFNHLYTLSFTEFFVSHSIDIPTCFRNSKSLGRSQRELKFLNFITYFTRHGRKLQMQNMILRTCNQFMLKYFYRSSVSISYS